MKKINIVLLPIFLMICLTQIAYGMEYRPYMFTEQELQQLMLANNNGPQYTYEELNAIQQKNCLTFDEFMLLVRNKAKLTHEEIALVFYKPIQQGSLNRSFINPNQFTTTTQKTVPPQPHHSYNYLDTQNSNQIQTNLNSESTINPAKYDLVKSISITVELLNNIGPKYTQHERKTLKQLFGITLPEFLRLVSYKRRLTLSEIAKLLERNPIASIMQQNPHLETLFSHNNSQQLNNQQTAHQTWTDFLNSQNLDMPIFLDSTNQTVNATDTNEYQSSENLTQSPSRQIIDHQINTKYVYCKICGSIKRKKNSLFAEDKVKEHIDSHIQSDNLCTLCSKPIIADHLEHINSHFDELNNDSSYCLAWATEKQISNHIKNNSTLNKEFIVCHTCALTRKIKQHLFTKDEISKHISSIHLKNNSCHLCSEDNITNQEEHITAHINKLYDGSSDCLSWSTVTQAANHKAGIKRKTTLTEEYMVCQLCHKKQKKLSIFKTDNEIALHLEMHIKNNFCDFCSAENINPQGHIASHIDELIKTGSSQYLFYPTVAQVSNYSSYRKRTKKLGNTEENQFTTNIPQNNENPLKKQRREKENLTELTVDINPHDLDNLLNELP